ncbi:hypothetical protein BN2476_930037 [Paraburkholderia piptadeniae]|uniref:Uncharacterized protein n=1 Tax=Paraburkholderia piptadeniae TaxID=1701573 RepID=A0A1N7SUY8_9BURK|nr:hypothetical protein BN2476_930037 [Paraburkholderia piptadeniae]
MRQIRKEEPEIHDVSPCVWLDAIRGKPVGTQPGSTWGAANGAYSLSSGHNWDMWRKGQLSLSGITTSLAQRFCARFVRARIHLRARVLRQTGAQTQPRNDSRRNALRTCKCGTRRCDACMALIEVHGSVKTATRTVRLLAGRRLWKGSADVLPVRRRNCS